MNTYRHDEQLRRQWVRDKHSRQKTVKQICTEAGISRATLYNWIQEFAGEETVPVSAELPPAPAPSAESFGAFSKYEMLASALAQVDADYQTRRKLVQSLVRRYTITVAQACQIVGLPEEAYGYKPRKPEVEDELVASELSRLINESPGRGFVQCYELLRSLYPSWTRKQIKRVYRERRLYRLRQRMRPQPQISSLPEAPQQAALPAQPEVRTGRPDAIWNLGLMEISDLNSSQAPAWILYILDDADQSLLHAQAGPGTPSSDELIDFMDMARTEWGRPKRLRIPAVAPFIAREVQRWGWEQKAAILSMSLGKEENLRALADQEAHVRRLLFEAGEPQSLEALISRIDTITAGEAAVAG
jgi:hypothetical protein